MNELGDKVWVVNESRGKDRRSVGVAPRLGGVEHVSPSIFRLPSPKLELSTNKR